MSKTEKTSIEFSDLNVTLSLDTDNFPEELKTPLSQTYDPESTYAMSGVAVGEALKPVYDKISTVLGGVDQTYSPRSASAQSGIAVKQAIDDVENRIKEFDNALEGCNSAAIMAREAANRAAASSVSAQKSASTAVFAKSDLETARDTAVSAATTATDAASAASSVKSYLETARDTAVSAATTATNAATAAATSETNATTAATAATAAQTAAQAAQAQADTDARACAIYDQRVAANATAATEAATTATEAATTATEAASRLISDELQRDIDLAIAAYLTINNESSTIGNYITDSSLHTGIPRLSVWSSGDNARSDIFVSKEKNIYFRQYSQYMRVLYAPIATSIDHGYNLYPMKIGETCYVHAPNWIKAAGLVYYHKARHTKIIFSRETTFSNTENIRGLFFAVNGEVEWAPGTKFDNVKDAYEAFSYESQSTYNYQHIGPPDTATFKSLTNASKMFLWNKIEKLPSAMVMTSALSCPDMFTGCYQLEVDEIVRVCSTINDLQSLDTPKTGILGLPSKCKHNGSDVPDTHDYLNANHPDFLTTLSAKGWTVTFA